MFFKKNSMILASLLCSSSFGLLSVDISRNRCSWASSSSSGPLEREVPTNNNSITIEKHDDDGTLKMIKWNASIKEQSSVSAIISNSKEQETISGVYNATTNNLTYADYSSKYFRDIKAKSKNNQATVKNSYQDLPYTSTGLLKSDGSEYGSCFLLGNGYVLTAAHCVYLDKGYFSNITASFGYKGPNQFTKTVSLVNAYLPLPWIASNPVSDPTKAPTDAQKKYDWAVLEFSDKTLPQTFGATTIASNETLNELSSYMSLGYPMDNDYKLTYSLGRNFISQSDERYELYSYTTQGMSGGPLISFHSEYDERIQETLYYNYVIGINSTCEPDTTENAYYLYSGITKITNTMIDFIRGLK